MDIKFSVTAGQAATFSARIYENFAAASKAGLLTSSNLPVFYKPTQPVEGFVFLKAKFDSASNYYGEAWLNPRTNEVVVVSRGTVPDTRDVKADATIAAGHVPSSAAVALAFTTEIAFANPDSNIISVGHSKGGYEAQFANTALTNDALILGNPNRFAAFTVDAPAFGSSVVQQYSSGFSGANATNVIATTDPVSQLTYASGLVLPGRTVSIPLFGEAGDPKATPASCAAAAQRAATIFDL